MANRTITAPKGFLAAEVLTIGVAKGFNGSIIVDYFYGVIDDVWI